MGDYIWLEEKYKTKHKISYRTHYLYDVIVGAGLKSNLEEA